MFGFGLFLIGAVWHSSIEAVFVVVDPRKGWRRMLDADALKHGRGQGHGFGERREVMFLEEKNIILWDIVEQGESELAIPPFNTVSDGMHGVMQSGHFGVYGSWLGSINFPCLEHR